VSVKTAILWSVTPFQFIYFTM